MTLLAATIGDGCVLVGADGQAVMTTTPAPPGLSPYALARAEKFEQVGELPLMWGIVGTDTPKREFVAWLQTLPIESWSPFASDVADKIAEVNATIRRRIERAGGEAPKPGELFSVMFAGYVAGESEILTVDEDGWSTWHADKLPAFHGPFGPTVRIVWQIAQRMGLTASALRDPDDFRSFLDAVVNECPPPILPPLDCWRITQAGGCEPLR